LTSFRMTRHAQQEMVRRQISESIVEQVLHSPGQILVERGDRKVYQSQVEIAGKTYLVRVIVEDWMQPAVVVTVYRTSNIAKYWRQP
jgi:hypothetical protein